jgi:hypothetical protein
MPLLCGQIERHDIVLRDAHQGLFLQQIRVVVHEAPQNKHAGFGDIAQRRSPPCPGRILTQECPGIRWKLGIQRSGQKHSDQDG